MAFYIILLSAVFALISGAAIEPQNKTEKSCEGSVCPAYEILINSTQYKVELRNYDPVTLVSYESVPCLSYSAALSQGYYHLSIYSRYGANVEKQILNMSAPVLMEVKHVPDVDERCSRVYTTSFYINNANLPQPVNKDIKINALSNLKLYVLKYNDIVSKPEDKVVELRLKLNALKYCYDSHVYYIASYSSPRSLLSSSYEVLLPAVDC